MHPAEEIRGLKWRSLSGKIIALGVSYSVALYKSIDVARELLKRDGRVKVIMTREASRVISPEVFHWATGEEPVVELTGETEHVSLAKEVSSMAIAPATLNVMSKLAYGVTDDPVVLTALNVKEYGKPVLIFPSMHLSMLKSPQYERAKATLEEMGYVVVEPTVEGGRVRFPEPEWVANLVESVTLRGRDYRGIKALVTSGPTREYIDRIRLISNPSTGKMGSSLAWELFARGAEVTVVHGPSQAVYPPWVKRVPVETTEEMAEAVSEEEYDVAFLAAAPADYKPERRFEGKLDSAEGVELKLVPTPKVAKRVRARVKVGFTAIVGEDVLGQAENKLEKYGFDMIVANRVDRKDIGFASDMNEVFILHKDGRVKHVAKVPKLLVARAILDEVKELLRSDQP
ncbi:bifunctional phosphopantothenoylcysteine decarboxylase/phosphopantothenate--cysteine ligase CoaBC [Ignicoccus hospitalis]|uniref:Coenzyme A biosynthesis bifunctional protein CoaBC n=1 Tax=Ignicoccus hospitalis (strain KIN4/I / DSM 18386 / JCM 14125) TaxID=453591 RepID=A8A9Y4_IGNH4|nr:bifunctional phosphopantothenoylcysteine decarboxylase/phosphopantothenate--cysteine ligase CoaBC [Ignicoccus hospitalis]ABU81736.1 Phosphopantothenoylcysteine decarboxylase [Ignicoccus hospitalis KIN4/I]HIH90001.1 bifunctional phosphopantothenoylcysteine decarboxylase/phosphopantothenate--cysteine ligase CoaBC [Desulfurococcaceae archaeon]